MAAASAQRIRLASYDHVLLDFPERGCDWSGGRAAAAVALPSQTPSMLSAAVQAGQAGPACGKDRKLCRLPHSRVAPPRIGLPACPRPVPHCPSLQGEATWGAAGSWSTIWAG